MTFLQPWAWIGLVALAGPIVAHLLARRSARRLPFPTVRFLPPAIQTPISRDRLTDITLLVVRCLILVAAAAALAPLADWVDLDGHLLLARDPARGLGFVDGVVRPQTAPGLGVSLTEDVFAPRVADRAPVGS